MGTGGDDIANGKREMVSGKGRTYEERRLGRRKEQKEKDEFKLRVGRGGKVPVTRLGLSVLIKNDIIGGSNVYCDGDVSHDLSDARVSTYDRCLRCLGSASRPTTRWRPPSWSA